MRTKTPDQAEKILSAATRLFGTHRFHEVRMEDIAAEAEVGKGTLYRYFADKEELYKAILARSTEQLLKRIKEIAGSGTSPRCRLEAMVAGVIDHFDAEPHLHDLIQRAEVMAAPKGDFPWQHLRQELPRLVQALFAEAAAQGEFQVRDPELTVHILLGAVRAVLRFGPKPRPDRLAQRLLENFLHGAEIRPRPSFRGSACQEDRGRGQYPPSFQEH